MPRLESDKPREWKREGWVKLHIAVNVKTKETVSMRLTDERVHDVRWLGPSSEKQRVHIVKLLADGAYDSRELFNLLQEFNIEPVVKVRKNSSRLTSPAQERMV